MQASKKKHQVWREEDGDDSRDVSRVRRRCWKLKQGEAVYPNKLRIDGLVPMGRRMLLAFAACFCLGEEAQKLDFLKAKR
jgi:hypothetical protein